MDEHMASTKMKIDDAKKDQTEKQAEIHLIRKTIE